MILRLTTVHENGRAWNPALSPLGEEGFYIFC